MTARASAEAWLGQKAIRPGRIDNREAEKLPCFFNAWEVLGGVHLFNPYRARERG